MPFGCNFIFEEFLCISEVLSRTRFSPTWDIIQFIFSSDDKNPSRSFAPNMQGLVCVADRYGWLMNEYIKTRLEEANKLIFVKQYDEADAILKKLVSHDDGRSELLVHLRYIELATMLKNLEKLREFYLKKVNDENGETWIDRVCLCLVEQHGEFVPPEESINVFQKVMQDNGPTAAAYFGIGISLENQGDLERAIYNYEQSIAIESDWYPSYFCLSQIMYHLGEEKRGDHYFYLFEQAAPYNVYGNFETHRRLYQEFLETEKYDDAEASIRVLSEWWLENKGFCPTEIQIYELLANAKVSDIRGDTAQFENRTNQADTLAISVLESKETKVSVFYFIAKIMEEFGHPATAFKFYKKILQQEAAQPALIQKIGSQFLTTGEYEQAKELFEAAYEVHPSDPDVRFCLLVSKLKLANVNVEDYLIGRERLRQLANGGDKVELLALLHSLMAKFQDDCDVQGHVADVYLKLGNIERAGKHYENMYKLDPKCRTTALKYAGFAMQYDDPEKAMNVLKDFSPSDTKSKEEQSEIYWLKANYFARNEDFRASLDVLRNAINSDPWNVSYLMQEIVNLTKLSKLDEELQDADSVADMLNSDKESEIDWRSFDNNTNQIEKAHAYELAYSRRKLRYLFTNGADVFLHQLVYTACKYDASRGTYDFMRLLNTNFDGADIYWALGIMFKELWQLETASMWFEQMLTFPEVGNDEKAKAYLELADCYTWLDRNLPKAIEYAKLSFDLGEQKNSRSVTVLAHAYLKSGQVRQAGVYLEQTDTSRDHEALFLQGLIQYRNGAKERANVLWKPLLTVRSESVRFHHIKQEILRFYFDGEPYLKAN